MTRATAARSVAASWASQDRTAKPQGAVCEFGDDQHATVLGQHRGHVNDGSAQSASTTSSSRRQSERVFIAGRDRVSRHAEAELAAVPAPSTVVRVDDLLRRLPEAVGRLRRMAGRLGNAPIDVERGRATLKGLIGPIWIAPRDGYLVAKMGLELQPLSVSSIRGSGGPLLIHLPTSTRSVRRSLTN